MKNICNVIILLLFWTGTLDGNAQIETKRWWNVGATTDTGRAVFCADGDDTPLDALLEKLKTTTDETFKLQLYLRIVRSYQDQTLIYKAITYADSALILATKLKDSLSLCRIHTASVYNMDLCGNPGAMLNQALLAQSYIPYSLKGTIEEFKVYAVTGDAYNALLQYDEAEKSYQKAKDIIQGFGNEKCNGYINLSLGSTRQNNGKLYTAIEAYQESVATFEALQDTLTCCVLYGYISNAYFDLGLRDQQQKYLLRTLAWIEKITNPVHRASIYRDLASFYREQNDSLHTAYFYNKAIESYMKVPRAFSPELGDSYNDMADFYYYMGDQAKALAYQRVSIRSYQAYPRPVTLMTYKMGYLYQAFGNLDSAYYYYNDAYKKMIALDDPRLLAICAKGMSKYYFQAGDIKKAIHYAEISYGSARSIRWIEMVCDISGFLSDLYAVNHDYQRAYNFQIRFRRLTDSLNVAENNRKTAHLAAQVEFADREAKMNMQISDQQRKIHQQNIFTVLLTCVLILAVIIGVMIWKNNKHRKQINIQLSEQKDELAAFNEELAATNEELFAVNEELQRTYNELDRYKSDLELMVGEKTNELQQAFVQVQESDKFKSAFFANMSHEIRTPLNAILGFLQFIDKQGISAQQRVRMITLINAHAGHLLSLVDDIVDLSKIDSGLLTIRPDLVTMNELLNEVYQHAEQLIQYTSKKRLALVIENRLPESKNMFFMDGNRIKQILYHLLDNAIKFTKTGYIMFGCEISEDNHFLHFFVEDTGIGIATESQPDIFKRFWKQGEIYTQQYRGLGIGLSLCESLVQLMGGTFSVTSTYGQGSTFRFTIKISESAE